jgi:hypothetical protein
MQMTERVQRVPLLTYDFPLRPDLIVRLTLPVGLTREEAQRISGFIFALVMPEPVVEAVIHAAGCESATCGGECDA